MDHTMDSKHWKAAGTAVDTAGMAKSMRDSRRLRSRYFDIGQQEESHFRAMMMMVRAVYCRWGCSERIEAEAANNHYMV